MSEWEDSLEGENPDAGLCRRLPTYVGPAPGLLAGVDAMLEGVAASGRAALRWAVTAPTALYLGASQKAPAVDAAACRAAGIAAYQRAAGGTAVLGDAGLLGLDVALPRDHPLWQSDLTRSYRWLGEVWALALQSLGVPVEVVGVEEARADARDNSEEARLARLACFGGLSPFEVTLGGRKVVGMAQVRRRAGALLQSAVLTRWNPADLGALLAVPDEERPALIAALGARTVGLESYLGRPVAHAAVIAAVEERLAGCGLRLVDDAWTPDEQAHVVRLMAERYQPLSLDPS
jgi:lipoate-protein ligase A